MGSGQRVLREYRAVAHGYHFCDDCFHQISPGDYYEGSVMVIGRRLLVSKRHIEPCCPPPDFDDWCEEDDKEENELEEIAEEIPISSAA
ncbi:MAG: hypothetical protein PHH00_02675 [Candidatus Nanoarchaeia archaeon]|nr:hypothetical protein [Candidatus Nanoarchaeia archaeon]